MLIESYVYICAVVAINGLALKTGMSKREAILLGMFFPFFLAVAAVQCLIMGRVK